MIRKGVNHPCNPCSPDNPAKVLLDMVSSSPADCCHVAVFVEDVKDTIVGNYLLNKSHVEDLLSYPLAFHLFFK